MATISLPTYPSNVISVLTRNAAREAVKYNSRAGNHRDKVLAGALRAIERSQELRRLLEKEQREWAKRLVA
jgi:hypothetical protein